ncbi:MAG TPA: prenyltransferase/squalene oxidase repeat-containing protein [Puia sp.]|nr:prenyltransferase/squalene oxidase repeat-containing protein [Puia sp.]
MKRKTFSTLLVIAGSVALLNLLGSWKYKPGPAGSAEIKQSASKALLLLQKSGYIFINNTRTKCASCHHNTLTSMATEIAQRKGIPVIDSLSGANIAAMERDLVAVCNPNLTNQFLAGVNFGEPYLLVGLAAEKYKPNFITDIAVDYLMSQVKADGSFLAESGRDPMETGDIHLTALAIRSIQLYASAAKQDKVNQLVAGTRTWLESQQTGQQQELCFQLLGLHWCGSSEAHKNEIGGKIKAMQNADGGWSQLPTLKSDAYATGQALYALYESGVEKTAGAVYQKGLEYLLKTQEADGSWFVATRSFPIQPFVNSDFPPYDENQFISAAGTNWAVMALLNALPDL